MLIHNVRFETIRELTLLSVFTRILISVLIGGLLGIERGRKNRPAGFRTYTLACLGSAIVMMTNQFVYQCYHESDPVRLGAQVVSGIGFLGAGTIMVNGRNQIKGITTAAGMWTAACCGLAVGIGFYEGAIIGSATVFLIMSTMRQFDSFIRKHASIMEVYVEFEPDKSLSQFLQYIRFQQFNIVDIQMNKNKLTIGQCAILSVESQIKRAHDDIIEIIGNAPGILFWEEL